MKVVIVGAGPFGQGLASLAIRSGATASYSISLGTRKMGAGQTGTLPGLEATPVAALCDVLPRSDMVILALPAGALPSFVAANCFELAGKIVVDVTNPVKSDYQKLGAASHSLKDVTLSDCLCDVESKDLDQLDKGCRSDGSTKGTHWPGTVSSTATWLASVLPSSARVVKAFNNLSAYSLIHGDPLTEHMKSVAATNDSDAAAAVAEFGRAMGLEMRVVASLSYASALESRQHSMLPAWQWPTWLMLLTWLVVHVYSFIRYNLYGETPWQHVTLWILNKSVGWVSLWGMVYTYLPGVLVCYWQLLSCRPAVRLPGWFKAWIDARKQLGLLSLAAMLLHLLFSTFLWMPSYYSKLWENSDTAIMPLINGTQVDKFGFMKSGKAPPGMQVLLSEHNLTYSTTNTTVLSTWPVAGPKVSVPAALNSSHPTEVLATVTNIITLRSQLNWIGESSTLLGIISGCLMGLIALTSLPSITPKMNWREWRLLQSNAGWLALITATVHVLLLGAPWWPKAAEDWPKLIPTITLMSTLPPMMLLLLKALLVLPPLSMLLARVHSGKLSRKDVGGDPLARLAVFAVKHD